MKARRWHRGTLLGLVLAVTLVAAGCGDDGGDGGSTDTTAGAGAAPAVDEALAAKVPDTIKSDGKLLIGTDPTYALNEFLDTDGKTAIGFDVDLFNAVAAKLGLGKDRVAASKFADIIPGLQSASTRPGCRRSPSTTSASSRSTWSATSAPAPSGDQDGNPGIQPDNACGKKVAVQTATVQETEDLPQRNKDCESAGNPAITIDSYQDQGQASAAVVSGKDDAMLADSRWSPTP